MNTKYYPNRVLLISNPSPTHELYRIKMMEIETKISHGTPKFFGLYNNMKVGANEEGVGTFIL